MVNFVKKDITKEKKYSWRFILLLAIPVLLFLLSLILSKHFPLVRIISLILVFLFSGMGFAKFFKETFKYENQLDFVINSLVLGTFLSVFFLLMLGMIGVVYTDTFLIIFFSSLSVTSLLYTILSKKDSDLEKFFDKRIQLLDILWALLFLLLFYLLTQICLEQFFPNWDSFTFWAIDAKYLFENMQLRDVSFNLLREVSYSSFYSFYFLLIYKVLGGIYEQFASIITVYFALLSCLLVFKRIYKQPSKRLKSFQYLFLLLVPIIFLSIQNIIVTLYVDIFCSFLVLLFTVVLLQSRVTVDEYYKRLFLLSVIATGLYLAKSPYMVVTIFLLLVFILYDIKYWIKNFQQLKKQYGIVLVILLLGLLFAIQQKHLSQFNVAGIMETTSKLIRIASLKDYSVYIESVLKFIMENAPYIFFLYVAFFCSLAFGFFKVSRKTKYFLAILVLGTLFIPLFFYVIRLGGLTSKSLLRYMGISFFACSYAFTYMRIRSSKNKEILYNTLFILFTILAGLFLLSQIYLKYNLNFKFEPHSGRYKDSKWQEGFYKIAEKAESYLPRGSKVLIVDEVGAQLGNMAIPAIYVRYYMSNSSVGGQYTTPIEVISKTIEESAADYILVLGYDGYWSKCSSLSIGETYLIKKEDLNFSNACPIEDVTHVLVP
ncbi:MAG: hypothetical protein ACOX06_02645 [Candidatus Dojkabacteria bacterium]|jgi:hypothetical protein